MTTKTGKRCPSCNSNSNVGNVGILMNSNRRSYYCKKCDLTFTEDDSVSTYNTNVLKEINILKESISILENVVLNKQSESTFEIKPNQPFELGKKEIKPEIKTEIDPLPIEEWGEKEYEDRIDGKLIRSSTNMIKKIINMRKKDEMN